MTFEGINKDALDSLSISNVSGRATGVQTGKDLGGVWHHQRDGQPVGPSRYT